MPSLSTKDSEDKRSLIAQLTDLVKLGAPLTPRFLHIAPPSPDAVVTAIDTAAPLDSSLQRGPVFTARIPKLDKTVEVPTVENLVRAASDVSGLERHLDGSIAKASR